ncbi:aminotransferase class V-fold PLP-dependent enzyme [Novosphingobium panipatense]
MAVPNIYLDHAATTPMLPAARDAWLEGAAIWANPSSPHAAGRAARAALEDARARFKAALSWEGEVIFTSGASEALAIGLGHARVDRRVVSSVEHDAVLRAAPDAERLLVSDGAIDEAALAQALGRQGRAVVAVQSINSETGTILHSPQDASLAQRVREAGGMFLADCSQSAGKHALPEADMIVLSAHKLGGPVGIGALLVRDFGMLEPTGGQERGYRAGTENLPGALAFVAALEKEALPVGVRALTRERRSGTSFKRGGSASAGKALLAHHRAGFPAPFRHGDADSDGRARFCDLRGKRLLIRNAQAEPGAARLRRGSGHLPPGGARVDRVEHVTR